MADVPVTVGSGGELLDPHHERADVRLLERAIKERWPIDDKIRRLALGRVAVIAANSTQERNRIAATRVLVQMDQINAAREIAAARMEGGPSALHQHVHIEAGNQGGATPSDVLSALDERFGTGSDNRPAIPPSNGNGRGNGRAV